MASGSWTMLRVIGVLELLFTTCILIYDFYRTKQAEATSNVNKKKTPKWVKSYKILTYVYIVLVYMHSLNLVLSQNNVYGITDSSGCWIRININADIHQIAKTTLYFLLITRLMASYAGSAHEYSLKKVIIPFYAFIILHFIYTILISSTRGHEQTPYDTTSISSCRYVARATPMAIWQLWDIIISIILLVLFLRPLHKLLKTNQNEDKGNTASNNQKYFMSVITKTAVLCSWAILSTLVCVMLYTAINSWIVLLLDNNINIIAVLLMKSCHANLYQKFCGKCCGQCCLCLCCCGYGRNVHEMNLVKSIQANSKENEKSAAAESNAKVAQSVASASSADSCDSDNQTTVDIGTTDIR